MLYVAQVAVCSQINTKHINTVWAERTILECQPFKAYRFLYVPQGLTFKNSKWRSLCVECFVRISEQAATFALYIIN